MPKRPAVPGRASGSNKKRSVENESKFNEHSLFCKLMKKCGVKLSDGFTAIEISNEPNALIKLIGKKVKAHDDYPEVIDDYVSGIEEYIDDQNRFIRGMHNTEMSNDEVELQYYDSIIKILLQVNDFQEKLSLFLISKLADYRTSDSVNVCGLGMTEEVVNVPQLIVNQFRWLTFYQKYSATVFNKFMEMVYLMPFQSASLIISSIPDIFSDTDHEMISLKLKELLDESSVLTVVILDTFTSLNFSGAIKGDIARSAFNCFSSAMPEELPILTKFVLKMTNSKNKSDHIKKLLNALDVAKISDESIMVSVVDALYSSIQYQHGIAESLLDALESTEYGKFTASDFVIILLLFGSTNQTFKKGLLTFVKNKLGSGSITSEVIKKAFTKCFKIFELHFLSISFLSSQLIHSYLDNLKKIGFDLHCYMFVHLNDFCKQEVIGSLVQEIGSLNSSIVDIVLKIFLELSKNHNEKLLKYSLFVKNIVEYVQNLSASQVRQVYEILGRLAFGKSPGQVAALEDDINILLKKQLSHNSLKYQYIGVIGAVRVFFVLSSHKGNSNNYYSNSKNVLNMLYNYTNRDSNIRSIYYDELAMLLSENIPATSIFNIKFKHKLMKMLIDDFNDHFLKENGESNSTILLPVTKIFETDNDAIKITCPDSKLIFLCSLCSALNHIKDKDLKAVLYTGLQTYDTSNSELIKSLKDSEKCFVLDTLFYSLNWLHEVLNCLCMLGCSSQQKDIILTLQNMINVERKIENMLGIVTNYNPPEVKISLVNPTGNSPKKIRPLDSETAQETLNRSNNSTLESTESENNQTKKKSTKKKSKPKAANLNFRNINRKYFRELDTSVVDLLDYAIDTHHDETSSASLKTEHLLFVLNDIHHKCAYKLTLYQSKKRVSPFSHKLDREGYENLDMKSESEFGKTMTKALPAILKHVITLTSTMETQDFDEEVLVDENCVTSCFEKVIDIIRFITLWHENNLNEEDTIQCLGTFEKESERKDDLKGAFTSLVDYLKPIIETIPSLKAAQSVINLLSGVMLILEDHKFCSSQNDSYDDLYHQISDIVRQFLAKDWTTYSADNDIKLNDVLESLLKIYFNYQSETLEAITEVVEKSLCPLIEQSDTECMFPCFKKANVHIAYRCLFKALTDEIAKIPVVKQGLDESAAADVLLKWQESNKILTVLTRLLKSFPGRSILIAALKFGRIYIDVFIKSALASCTYLFLQDQEEVILVLKSLQIGTRQLQHLSCHSKVTKDVLLSKHIPQLKMALEKLIFQVKGLLAQFKCTEGFWLGNLKNKNLSGEEILTQECNSEDITGDDTTCNESYSECY